jgi:hypothetical protein
MPVFSGLGTLWTTVANIFMEGLNSVFQATKRKARGYRSSEHLTTMPPARIATPQGNSGYANRSS